MDFPVQDIATRRHVGRIISSIGEGGIGDTRAAAAGTTSATTWPVANTAIFIPFCIAQPFTINTLGWYNGATAAGSLDAGIYRLDGTRIVSTGSVAQAGISAPQLVTVASTLLTPGNYALALAATLTTTTIFAAGGSFIWLYAAGLRSMASALPLPPTATFSYFTTASFCPMVFATDFSSL